MSENKYAVIDEVIAALVHWNRSYGQLVRDNGRLEAENKHLRPLIIDMAEAIIEHCESNEDGCVFCHASAMDPHSADCIVPKAREVLES